MSNQPGTTRDLVEVMLDLDGIPIRFVDTAGIHQTDDMLENMGIDKAVKMIKKSDLVLYVSDDINCKFSINYDVPYIKIINKIDLHKSTLKDNSIIHISAKNGQNVDILLKKIKKALMINTLSLIHI